MNKNDFYINRVFVIVVDPNGDVYTSNNDIKEKYDSKRWFIELPLKYKVLVKDYPYPRKKASILSEKGCIVMIGGASAFIDKKQYRQKELYIPVKRMQEMQREVLKQILRRLDFSAFPKYDIPYGIRLRIYIGTSRICDLDLKNEPKSADAMLRIIDEKLSKLRTGDSNENSINEIYYGD